MHSNHKNNDTLFGSALEMKSLVKRECDLQGCSKDFSATFPKKKYQLVAKKYFIPALRNFLNLFFCN